jgi:hypothetical protein
MGPSVSLVNSAADLNNIAWNENNVKQGIFSKGNWRSHMDFSKWENSLLLSHLDIYEKQSKKKYESIYGGQELWIFKKVKTKNQVLYLLIAMT